MNSKHDFLHLHVNLSNRRRNVALFLLPVIVFFLVLVLGLFFTSPSHINQYKHVLGVTTQNTNK